jgi:predicted RNA binding protein YcfA (HicA-like mRNA interferase family)
MAAQVTRRAMTDWLKDHGFELQPGKATGHQYWVKEGCKITLPGHGPQDLTKKHVALTIRALERAGFNREDVRKELGA